MTTLSSINRATARVVDPRAGNVGVGQSGDAQRFGIVWGITLPAVLGQQPLDRPAQQRDLAAKINDRESAQLASDLLGQETVVFETMSRALDAEGSGISFGQQHVGRALLTPDEVRTLSPDRQLLFLAGRRPVIATKLCYYADREFIGRFDPA